MLCFIFSYIRTWLQQLQIVTIPLTLLMFNDILKQTKREVLCNKMKKLVSFFLVVCIATFLASCGGKADNLSNNKAVASDYELPSNYNLDFDSIADELISSESIDGMKIGTSYRSLLARYGEPTSKSSEFKTTSGSVFQVWEYLDMGAEYTMIKSQDDYTIDLIKVFNKSPFSTEHDIKIGIPVNNVNRRENYCRDSGKRNVIYYITG